MFKKGVLLGLKISDYGGKGVFFSSAKRRWATHEFGLIHGNGFQLSVWNLVGWCILPWSRKLYNYNYVQVPIMSSCYITIKRITIWNGHAQPMFAFPGRSRVLSLSERLVSDDAVASENDLWQWSMCPEGSKIEARWNCLPKEIRLCDEIEAFTWTLKTYLKICKWVYSCNSIWRINVKRPRMLSAQFVALYKPCKPRYNGVMEFGQSWIRKFSANSSPSFSNIRLLSIGFFFNNLSEMTWICEVYFN